MKRRIAIAGAGMAGASLAAALAPHDAVTLLEAEDQPGYHATGRSAAFWSEAYGGPGVQPLTSASEAFLADPLPRFGGTLLHRRGELVIARDSGAIDRMAADFAGTGVTMTRCDPRERVPQLKAGWSGLWLPSTADIDVARLHAGYLAQARADGACLRCRAGIARAERRGGVWRIILADGDVLEADVLVNAAGAWGDALAEIAGAAPIGLGAYRRTVVQLRIDPPVPASLPLVIDAAGDFYFKPEAGGRLWLSPHDETPQAPGDAAAEELDVALAIHRFEQATDWRIAVVERRWAGLRSFAPDRLPVYGFDPRVDGLFWCAGQGGFGIQTAPAAARLCAALLGRGTVPDGVDAARYEAARFG